jgi:hypothetical protein
MAVLWFDLHLLSSSAGKRYFHGLQEVEERAFLWNFRAKRSQGAATVGAKFEELASASS